MLSKPSIKAIILAGTHNFGRCTVAAHLSVALWPVAGKPVLERLINSLFVQGIKNVTICTNGDSSLLRQSIHFENQLEISFLNEELPVGAAGCIRDAARPPAGISNFEFRISNLLIVMSASIVSPPKIDELIKAHLDGGSDLTVMFNPGDGDNGQMGKPADIYICNPNIIEHIPKEGYFDIKEGLIPKMLRAGKTVYAAILPNHVGNFRDWQGYLRAISNYLEDASQLKEDLKLYKQDNSQNVWMAANAKVEKGAHIYGPTVIMDGACILEGSVIFGPTIVGRNVRISKNSVVVNSVLWDDAQIGPNCQIQQCVVDYHAAVPANSIVQEKCVVFKPSGLLNSIAINTLKTARNSTNRLQSELQSWLTKIIAKLPVLAQLHKTKTVPWAAAGLVLMAFLWSYQAQLKELWNIWQGSDEYSSGLLVPFLAAYILLSRRDDIAQCSIKPAVLWGLFAFLIAQGSRLLGLFFMYGSAERLSIALSIAAVVLLLFGWKLFRKVSTVLLFLCLMLPWPNRIQAAVTLPMQRWATSSAVFCLEMLGFEVLQEGNIIHIGSATVAIAEACNGLRMVTAFFVISGLVVLLAKRAWWEKLIVLASSLPIALFCNTTRLATTALAFTVLSGEHWEKIFHDFGGYAMMPLALAIVVAELWLLARLTTLPTEEQPIIITRHNK